MKIIIFFALLSCGVLAIKNPKVWTWGDQETEILNCFTQQVIGPVEDLNKEISFTAKRPDTQPCKTGKYAQYKVCLTTFVSFISFDEVHPDVSLDQDLVTTMDITIKIKPHQEHTNGILTVCDQTMHTGAAPLS